MDNIIVIALGAAVLMSTVAAVSLTTKSPKYIIIGNASTGGLALFALWMLWGSMLPVLGDMRLTEITSAPGVVSGELAGTKLRANCCPTGAVGYVNEQGEEKPKRAGLSFSVPPGEQGQSLKCRAAGEQDFGRWTWRHDPGAVAQAVEIQIEHKCDGVPWTSRDRIGPFAVPTPGAISQPNSTPASAAGVAVKPDR